MKFSDPMTAVTDYILAAEAFVFAVLLLDVAGRQWSIRFWAAAFVAVGISALAGGWFHHRRLELSDPARHTLWMMTAMGLLGSLALFLASGVFAAATGGLRVVLLMAVPAGFAGGIFRMTRSGGESFGVKRSIAILTVILLVLAAITFVVATSVATTGLFILVGSMICVAAVIIQQAAPKLHRHFNHNDLCHVIFMIGLYFLYRGGLLLNDKM